MGIEEEDECADEGCIVYGDKINEQSQAGKRATSDGMLQMPRKVT